MTALGMQPRSELTPTSICQICATVLSVSGAGLVLMGTDGAPSASYASDARYDRVEELQFTQGVGPGIDAYLQGLPVIEDDLVEHSPTRWVGFPRAASAAGIGALFAFPLRVGDSRIGAITWYQDAPGELDALRYRDAVVTAEVVTLLILSMQAAVPEGLLAQQLLNEGTYHHELHQAVGMISVQLGVSVNEALPRLRAWAFANKLTMVEATSRIVAGELRLGE
jgi:hypothetical protein